MYEKVHGSKYAETSDLSTVEVAKLIRKDIKLLVKAGALPKSIKVSVRSQYFSGGSSIDIYIKYLPVDYPMWNDPSDHPAYAQGHRYSVELRALMSTLKKLHFAYNYDGSEIMTDYFNVRYYGDVSLDWQFERSREVLDHSLIPTVVN